jgi:hypothetical protein
VTLRYCRQVTGYGSERHGVWYEVDAVRCSTVQGIAALCGMVVGAGVGCG